MNTPLPVNRRTRTWYGSRIAPADPRPETPAPRRIHVPELRMAGLLLPIGSAPVDRPLTALL